MFRVKNEPLAVKMEWFYSLYNTQSLGHSKNDPHLEYAHNRFKITCVLFVCVWEREGEGGSSGASENWHILATKV